MGQQYDSAWHFTIADLYSFKLGLHKELINSICSGAVKEYALELELRSLAKKWTEKDFKLAKHFARTRTPPESELNSVLSRNSSRKVCGFFWHSLLRRHLIRLKACLYVEFFLATKFCPPIWRRSLRRRLYVWQKYSTGCSLFMNTID
jgi:hypothetical protein